MHVLKAMRKAALGALIQQAQQHSNSFPGCSHTLLAQQCTSVQSEAAFKFGQARVALLGV